MIELSPEEIAERRRGADPRPRRRRPPRPGDDRLPRGRRRRPLRRPARRPHRRRAASPPRRSSPAPGASLVDPARGEEVVASGAPPGWILAADDPLAALQALARGWRREIGCPLVGITGSTGKTSVKDICRAILPRRVHASPENFNTEIGLPLALLEAPPETEVLVLEMAMRGIGQIAELCAIAEPDVAAITNVGPVHLELLGTLEAIAEAKAEILDGPAAGGARRSCPSTPRRSSRTSTTRSTRSRSGPAATSSR